MKIKSLLFFWIICVQLIYSQSYVELFKESLPKIILENTEFRSTVEKNLEYYSSISPKLVYFYIDHLHKKHVMGINDPDSNLSKKLSDLTVRMLLLRNQWVLSEKEIINNSTENKLIESKSKAIVEDYFTENVSLLDNGADTNKIYYFYLKYLDKSNDEAYEPKNDYYKKCYSLIRDKVNYLNNIYSGYERTELESEKFLEYILENKFLFKNSYSGEIPLKTDFTLGEMLVRIYSPSSLEDYQVYLFVEGLYENYSFEDNIAIAETLGTTNSIVDISETFKNEVVALIDLGVGAKIKLKDQKSFLSHVDISGSLSILKFLNEPENLPRSASRTYRNMNNDYTAKYFISEPENSSLLSFKFSSSIPLFFESYFSAGVGVEYRYLKYSYDIKNSRNDETLSSTPVNLVSYDKTNSFEHIENRISALAYVDFNMSKIFTLRLQYKTPNVVSLSIRVGPSL